MKAGDALHLTVEYERPGALDADLIRQRRRAPGWGNR
jgi:hypothetical protein